jgi:hypothetical protein
MQQQTAEILEFGRDLEGAVLPYVSSTLDIPWTYQAPDRDRESNPCTKEEWKHSNCDLALMRQKQSWEIATGHEIYLDAKYMCHG